MLNQYIPMSMIQIGSSYMNAYNYGYSGSLEDGMLDISKLKKEILELQNQVNELIQRNNDLEEALKGN